MVKSFLLSTLIFPLMHCAFNVSSATREKLRTPPVYIKEHNKILVNTPSMDSSLIRKLSMIEWTREKYASELSSEISFQLEKKNVKIVTDSGQAEAFLSVHKYDPGNLNSPSNLAGYAILKTSNGHRRIEITQNSVGKKLFADKVSTIENIRTISADIVSKSMAKPKKAKKEPIYKPQMWMVF